jgi:hypothetical protein
MSEFKPVPHYIYARLCTDLRKPAIHIKPVTRIQDLKGYYGIEIVQSTTQLQALYIYCEHHNILLPSDELIFKPAQFNQISFLNNSFPRQ